MVKIVDLFDLEHTLAKDYLAQFTYPWEALGGIGEFLQMQTAKCKMQNCGRTQVAPTDSNGGASDYREVSDGVWVHQTATVAPSAVILPPCMIGANAEIRTGAFLRGNVLVGENCVVGNSAEVKNAILFDGVQVPHFNYVGDSILGYKAHLGAGAVTSNVRGDKALVQVGAVATGRKKVGAFVGDFGEIGCNAVLNPGTVIGRNSQVYPTACVRGIVDDNCIYKNDGTIIKKMQNAKCKMIVSPEATN